MKILLSWIGSSDVDGLGNCGPIYDVLQRIPIEKCIFLIDIKRTHNAIWKGGIIQNLRKQYPKSLFQVNRICMEDCNDVLSIFNATNSVLKANYKSELYINIKSGSKIMCASWMLSIDRLPKDVRQPILVHPYKESGKMKYLHLPEHTGNTIH